jgi:hypothetical protein
MTVDEFVLDRVLPEFRPIVVTLRELTRVCAPSVTEVISYGIPAYKGNRILAVISPIKKDVTFSISRGGRFEENIRLAPGSW